MVAPSDDEGPVTSGRSRIAAAGSTEGQPVEAVGVIVQAGSGRRRRMIPGTRAEDQRTIDRGQVQQEVDEAQARRGADEDVGRIPDERCRAADVRGEDLREQVRDGVDPRPCA